MDSTVVLCISRGLLPSVHGSIEKKHKGGETERDRDRGNGRIQREGLT